jgi:predicted enzyme related to lactoylglutathione lyase
MRKVRSTRFEERVMRDAEKLRRRRLADEAARGQQNAKASGRLQGLGRSPGEGDPITGDANDRKELKARSRKGTRAPARGFVHVDISADDPARAASFYEKVFGWEIRELPGETPYWLLLPGDGGGHGIGGGIALREQPWQSTMPTIEVPSVKRFAGRIADHGGSIVQPAAKLPGVGTLAVFRDTEGNLLAILEPTAADSSRSR